MVMTINLTSRIGRNGQMSIVLKKLRLKELRDGSLCKISL